MTKQQRLALVISILASSVAAIDGFIVNVALPAISRELGGGLALQQWSIDAYLIALGSLILVAGSLSDLFGRRRILAIGLVWFGIASLMCAAAPNGTFLVVARVVQGVGGALLVPSSLALIISVFSGETESKAIGTWTAYLSIATVAGPIIGGLILAVASWRWIFLVNVVPIAITLWLLARLDCPDPVRTNTKIDVPGALLCALGLGAPVYALIEKPALGWGNGRVWFPLIAGAALLAAFIWREAHTKQPMLPLSLFKVRNFTYGNLSTLAIYAGLSVSSFLITITLQQIGGFSPFAASLATMPVSIVMFLLSSRFGKLAGRYGPRLFMTTGPLVAAIGFLLMLRLQPHVRYFVDLFPGVLFFALGLSMTVAPLTSAVLGDVKPQQAGVASAVNNAIARIAGLVAIAFVGVITGPLLTIHGFRRVLITTAILMVVGGAISFVGIRNRVAPNLT